MLSHFVQAFAANPRGYRGIGRGGFLDNGGVGRAGDEREVRAFDVLLHLHLHLHWVDRVVHARENHKDIFEQ